MLNQHQRQQIQKAVKELNELVKVRLAPSKIHGVGVFAMRDLKIGERLYSDIMPIFFKLPYDYFDRLLPEVREILLEQYPNIVNGSAFSWPTVRWQGLMNHSETPNYSAMKDVMIKDCLAGEEITENYKLILNAEKVFPWIK